MMQKNLPIKYFIIYNNVCLILKIKKYVIIITDFIIIVNGKIRGGIL